MLNGDFTAIASAACNTSGAITLRAPFVDNKINPALFSPASVKLASLLPKPDDPCGQVFFDRIDNSDEDVFTTKVDYTINNSQSVFGRLLVSAYFAPSNYDGKTLLSPTTVRLDGWCVLGRLRSHVPGQQQHGQRVPRDGE